MRRGIIGGIVGAVIGIVIGATVIAPRLHPKGAAAPATPPAPPADVARELPRLLLPRPEVEIKTAGAVPIDTPLAGSLGRRFDSLISDVSRGQVEIQLYEPGILVPSGDLLDAVASGAIDAGFALPASLGNDIALQVFGGVPFGPDAAEFLAWIKFGGGRDLLEKLAEAHGTRALVCGLLPEPASGWFRKEIEISADLRGLSMAIDGLGARVLERLGVKTRRLDLALVGAALNTGTIDAVAFSAPALDLHVGLHNYLKYYYFPGWQQSPSALLLLVNLGKWRGLKSSQRVLIETVCGDNVSFSLADGQAMQYAALQELHAAGVQFRRWPSPIRDELQRSWTQIVEELASRDAEFRRVWASLSAFRDQYGVWSDLSKR